MPAIVTVLGRALFWPSKKWKQEPEAAHFGKIGNALGRRPAIFAIASGGLLATITVFAFSFNPSFDFNSSLPEDVDSTEGLKVFQEHFAAGAAEPAPVMLVSDDDTPLDPADLEEFQQAFEGVEGVDQGFPPQVSEDGTAAEFSLILENDPVSDAALEDVKGPIRTPRTTRPPRAPRRSSAARPRCSPTCRRRWPATTGWCSRSRR